MIIDFLALVHKNRSNNAFTPADLGEATPEKRFAFDYLQSRNTSRDGDKCYESVQRERGVPIIPSWHSILWLTWKGYDLWFELEAKEKEEKDRRFANWIAYTALVVSITTAFAAIYFQNFHQGL